MAPRTQRTAERLTRLGARIRGIASGWRSSPLLHRLVALTLVAGIGFLVASGVTFLRAPTSLEHVSLKETSAAVISGDVATISIDDSHNQFTLSYDDGRRATVTEVPEALMKPTVEKFADSDAVLREAPDGAPWSAGFLLTGIALLTFGVLGLLGLGTNPRRPAVASRTPVASEPVRPPSGHGPGDGQPASAGGSGVSASVLPAAVPDTRFRDVAGCEEAVEDLREIVWFLTDPDRFTRTGARPLKGALLSGPPGTGKTLLARAVAGEAGVPFFEASGSDFTEMFVGVGAKRVRELFETARNHGKAIVFIDEVDAIARKRSDSPGNSNTEGENTLIALLTEMDGFDQSSNVIVLAATNRPDLLDAALTRPGRLDRQVTVPNPDRLGREQILTVHMAGKPIAADVDRVVLARRTPGFSGAQLQAIVNEACLEAVRRDLEEVDTNCFAAAVATIAMGRARGSALVTENDRVVTAWHESGHTLTALLLPDADNPVEVTIVPRGPAGGVTWMSGNDDIFLSRRKAHARLVVAMAGRAAEEVLLEGEFTQGATGDLDVATDLAVNMATRYGMTRLGLRIRGADSPMVDEVVDELLTHALHTARALLAENRELLVAVAEALLVDETLSLAQVQAIAEGVESYSTEYHPPSVPTFALLTTVDAP
jgi:cell division protease FtsH